jgi:probable O-glycosylation ligase (exosortase A-associated)
VRSSDAVAACDTLDPGGQVRDLIVAAIVLSSLPFCYRRPILGLFMFSMLAYMRLQDLAWGFARFERWSFYVAVVTFAGFFSDRNRRAIVVTGRTVLIGFLPLWIFIGMFFAQGSAPKRFSDVIEYAKVVGVAVFTTSVVFNRAQLRMMMWVIALSFSFYGVKSGVAGIVSLGSMKIIQGPGGMLADNNDFALALGTSIPIVFYMGLSERRPILRRVAMIVVPLTLITIMATHSRGAFLATSVGVFVMVWRSRNRIAGLAIGMFLVLAAVAFAPSSYKDRISTIGDYESDGSAQGRLMAWKVARNMIERHPMTGVGFGRFKGNYFAHDTSPWRSKDHSKVAHNSYLQIWAECGTPAFLVYLILLFWSVLDVQAVRRLAKRRYHASWILNYCTMFEASLCTFMIGSVFLNRAHFDLIYHYFMIVMIFGRIAREDMKTLDATSDSVLVSQHRGNRRGGTLVANFKPGFSSVRVSKPGFRSS